MYPPQEHARVVPWIDDAPWHRGRPIDEGRRDGPHPGFERRPRDRPRLNPIERFWKRLRRRATHNHPSDALADLKTALRASPCDVRTARHEVKSIIEGRPRRKTAE